MRLLLDTHVFLWWRENSPRLGAEARRAIASAELVYVSGASAWEIAIKIGKGKLRLKESIEIGVEASQFTKLAVQVRHAAAVQGLEPHTSDPFDRMLIAQAKVERLVLVTADRRFAPYGVPVLWA